MTHVSYDFYKVNGIQIKPINKSVNMEGTRTDSISYLGYAGATLSLPTGKKLFEIDALLLIFSTTEYHKRVPVAIGTSISNMASDSLET